MRKPPSEAQKEKHRERNRQRYARYKQAGTQASSRIAQVRSQTRRALATPKWVDAEAIENKHHLAVLMENLLGQPYQVDHIIPICHAKVCGLHVPWNLQVISQSENYAKGSRWVPDK